MAANSRFAVALHALSVLGYFGDAPMTSETVAGSVNTNPVVIRRIFAKLKAAGLVESQPGNRGGLCLARTPNKITLADIYTALESNRFMAIHGNPENKKCPVSRNVKPVLAGVLDAVESDVTLRLKRTTLADFVASIRKKDKD